MTCIKITFKHVKDDKELCKEFVSMFKVNKNDLICKKIKFHSDSE